jgi:ParB/RepB/Spo0J family partition protein
MANKFTITELLNKRSLEAAAKEKREETEPEEIPEEGISSTADIYDLIPSQNNFYSVEDVTDLKQSIELLGVLQPLLVTEEKEDGKYRIIAGHRRRIAVLQLVEEGKERFRYVPILVKQTKSAILDKLALIMANRFREKTDWERMREALETETLAIQLKKEMQLKGRVRDLLAEIIESSPAQLGRYKAVYNHLTAELMTAFKADKVGITVIYELSQLPEDYQQKAAETFKETGTLSLSDAKQLKKQWEESQQIPGQQEMFTEETEEKGETEEDKEEQQEQQEQGQQSDEYIEPQPESVESLCYSCTEYEKCNAKKGNVKACNMYNNRREAQKTEEERYSEEQDKIDRETRKKLREQQQEAKMQQLPSDSKKERNMRISPTRYEEIKSGRLTFLLEKKDNFGEGELLEIQEISNGTLTGRVLTLVIKYIQQDWTGLEEDYCILGIEVVGETAEEITNGD